MLVTLADMKTYLNISDNSQDTFLTQQLNLFSEAIEGYCNRIFLAADYVQTFYPQDYKWIFQRRLPLYHFPLNTVASIDEDGTVLADTEYRLHKPTGFVDGLEGKYFLGCIKKTIVTYNAGYIYANLPKPLQNVVYALVQEAYNKKSAGIALNFGTGVQRVSIPGTLSIDFDYTLTQDDRGNAFGILLGSHLNVLDQYRSERTLVSGTIAFVE